MQRLSKSEKEIDEEHQGNTEAVRERLIAGKSILYRLKYEGSFLVSESRGVEPVRSAFKELRKAKEERRKHGIRHTPMKHFIVTLDSVSIRDPVSNEEELNYKIRSISYIVNDEKNRSYVGMIAQIPGKSHFECTILKHDDGRARDVVQTLGTAFDLAYDQNMKNNNSEQNQKLATATSLPPSSTNNSNSEPKDSNQCADDDITILKSRLRDLAVLVPDEKLKWYLSKQNISDITELPKRPRTETNSSKTENLIDTVDSHKPLPSVGTKLENLIWTDPIVENSSSPRRRSSTGAAKLLLNKESEGNMFRQQEEILLQRKISEGGLPIPRVNPPPRVQSKRLTRPASLLSIGDPFEMGDFNAVSFPEFDEFYTNLNETEKAEIDLLA